MFTAIVDFFTAIFKFVLEFITGVINWVRAHPRAALEVLGALCIALWVRHYYIGVTTDAVWKEANKTIDAQALEINKANAETAARDAKIKRLEAESKATADSLSTALVLAQDHLNSVVADYDRKLAEEKKKYKVVVVKEPVTGKDVEVNINPKGEVVCQRFPDAFKDSVNEILKQVNTPLPVSHEVTK